MIKNFVLRIQSWKHYVWQKGQIHRQMCLVGEKKGENDYEYIWVDKNDKYEYKYLDWYLQKLIWIQIFITHWRWHLEERVTAYASRRAVCVQASVIKFLNLFIYFLFKWRFRTFFFEEKNSFERFFGKNPLLCWLILPFIRLCRYI